MGKVIQIYFRVGLETHKTLTAPVPTGLTRRTPKTFWAVIFAAIQRLSHLFL
jgi:hypothetical protein